LLLFICICSLKLFAQEQKWAVSFTPAIAGVTSWQFGVQPGIIYKWSPRWELLTEISFVPNLHSDSSAMDPSYFRIKPELRYIISSAQTGPKWYAGLQMSYSMRK